MALFCVSNISRTTRCPRKTIWKAHRIRVANTADRRASPNRCRDRQRRSRMRTSQRSVDRSVKLPVVPALCAMLPMQQQERSRRDGVLLSCMSRYRYWSAIQFKSLGITLRSYRRGADRECRKRSKMPPRTPWVGTNQLFALCYAGRCVAMTKRPVVLIVEDEFLLRKYAAGDRRHWI